MTKRRLFLSAISILMAVVVAVVVLIHALRPPQPAAPATPGVYKDKVVFGSSLALGGHAGFLGTETLRGSMAYLRFINDSGGVHGRRIEVKAYDDGYDPPRTLVNTLRLIRDDHVFGLFDYVGTPTTVEVLPVINEAKIPLLGVFSGAQRFRDPFQRYVINVRASYYAETDMMVRHLVGDLGLKRIAVFYQYDSYGLDGLSGSETALARFHLKPVATGSYVRGTMAVEQGLERIIRSRPQAVIMIGTYDPCARFIKLAHERGWRPVFLNVSFVGPEELAQRLGEGGDGVLVTQVVPPPSETMLLKGARDYVTLLKRYYPDAQPTFVGLEGYVNARVLVEGLRRAGPDPDREHFIDAVESIHDFSLGIANPVDYGPHDHEGLEQVYMTVIKGGRFRLLTSGEALREEAQGLPAGTEPEPSGVRR
jgi:ABC-type branched-subunit amino acid transport system substrate-binding protein